MAKYNLHRWICAWRWLIVAMVAAAIGAPGARADSVRVMCVGDSITAGYTDNPTWSVPFEFGYRSGLYSRLAAVGYPVQFVGESLEPWNGTFGVPSNTPTLDLRPLGQDKHRGYGGAGTAQISGQIGGWLTADNPDVVLLMIGINDIAYGSTGNPAAAESNLNSIVQTIVSAKPDADVIVAQITPYSGYTDSIVEYNDYIRETLVPSYVAEGKHVSTVDQYANFLSDGVIDASLFSNGFNHPNATGYDRMAETWFAGILTAHPVPEPSTIISLAIGLLALLAYARFTDHRQSGRPIRT